MAVKQIIWSAFFTQAAANSQKLRIYEALFHFNQSVNQVAGILRGMKKFSLLNGASLQCAQDEIEEVRAGLNADLIEELGERERRDQGKFWKRRRRHEKKLEDPDDVYIDLRHREIERKKRGLPPRIGLIPSTVIAGEEEPRSGTGRKQMKGRGKATNRG
jgi:hypothetical protein